MLQDSSSKRIGKWALTSAFNLNDMRDGFLYQYARAHEVNRVNGLRGFDARSTYRDVPHFACPLSGVITYPLLSCCTKQRFNNLKKLIVFHANRLIYKQFSG